MHNTPRRSSSPSSKNPHRGLAARRRVASAALSISNQHQLRTVRNEAVHAVDAEFTRDAVEDYAEAALTMAIYLEDLAKQS